MEARDLAPDVSFFSKGPMFSQKTSSLIHVANIFVRCNAPVHIVAPAMSRRKQSEDQRVESHDGVVPLAGCTTVYLSRQGLLAHCEQFLATMHRSVAEQQLRVAPVICIDEAQFFFDLVKSCCAMRRQGVTVIVAGLTLTYQRKPFGEMHRLQDFADETVEKKSVCAICNTLSATLTHRTSAAEGDVAIGGKEDYQPVCQMCFEQLNERLQTKE